MRLQPFCCLRVQTEQESSMTMNRYLRLPLVLVMAALVAGCEQDCCNHTESLSDSNSILQGNWLLVERGYSPGFGYYTDPVPAFPAKTLTLSEQGRVVSTIDELKDYSYYQIAEDPASDEMVIGFFETKPHGPVVLGEFEHSYSIRWEEGNLML